SSRCRSARTRCTRCLMSLPMSRNAILIKAKKSKSKLSPSMRDDTSPVKPRLKSFQHGMPNVSFMGCENTLEAMARKESKEPALVENAERVKASVVTLIQLGEKGWTIVRPQQGPSPESRWPAGSGGMRRPLAPLPDRPNPTDPGDAADLSSPQSIAAS